MTGVMNIDKYGRRRTFNVTILDFRQNIVETGFWEPQGRLNFTQTDKEFESFLVKSIQEKEFIVTTRVVRNTLFLKNLK